MVVSFKPNLTRCIVEFKNLNHVTVGDPKNGPFVLVLNDGGLITAEDRAMLQALYSRSPSSVLSHLEKLAEVGSGKFMDSFYVGYGHKSIGDCGSTTIFIENVSMLVAKAVQDSMLYDGQEVSTRYLDMATQPFCDPMALGKNSLLDEMRQFYIDSLPVLKSHLRETYPIQDGEKESVYEKAVAARAFDILRGFLPAGTQTSLSWTTNLRQAADRLAILRVHPLEEIRRVAQMIEEALRKAHPHSFTQKRYAASETYQEAYMNYDYYLDVLHMKDSVMLTNDYLDRSALRRFSRVISTRPDKTELPKFVGEAGVLQFEFTLDFGSFRDLARQRAVIQRMPLLTAKHGFHQWYREQLPEGLDKKAYKLILDTRGWWRKQATHGGDLALAQYYLPMGYRVPCHISGDLPALVYLVELRSGSTVHATLRKVSQDMGKIIEGLGVPVYLDMSESGRFDVKRGNQDIVSR